MSITYVRNTEKSSPAVIYLTLTLRIVISSLGVDALI